MVIDLKIEHTPIICDCCKNLFTDKLLLVAVCTKECYPNRRFAYFRDIIKNLDICEKYEL
jgi:hypothetical protein